jgi:hypothetical protein
MKTFLTLLLATLCAAIANGQTIKTLGYNTTNGQIIYSGTNDLSFTNIEFFVRFREISAENIEAGIGTNAVSFGATGIDFAGVAAAATRTNLGFSLQALTNDSNATMMRALSGSTNTNHPFSGSVSVVGTNNTNTLVFSNGILQEVQ